MQTRAKIQHKKQKKSVLGFRVLPLPLSLQKKEETRVQKKSFSKIAFFFNIVDERDI